MFSHTLAVLEKIKNDLKKISFWLDIIIQVLFIGYYIYSMVINILNNHYVLMGIYIGFSFISISYFAFHLLTINASENFQAKIKSNVRNIVKYIKYALKLATLVISYILIIIQDQSDLYIILTVLLTAFFLFQIIFEVVRIVVSNYTDLLITSFKIDLEESNLVGLVKTASDPVGSFLNKVDKITSKMAKNEKKEEISEKEQNKRDKINQLNDDYKARKKQEKKEKHQKLRKNIKDNFKKIFSKKKKTKDNKQEEDSE